MCHGGSATEVTKSRRLFRILRGDLRVLRGLSVFVASVAAGVRSRTRICVGERGTHRARRPGAGGRVTDGAARDVRGAGAGGRRRAGRAAAARAGAGRGDSHICAAPTPAATIATATTCATAPTARCCGRRHRCTRASGARDGRPRADLERRARRSLLLRVLRRPFRKPRRGVAGRGLSLPPGGRGRRA